MWLYSNFMCSENFSLISRCAGEIAAVANEYCAVGVAFGAKVSGIRILDGPMTDSLEAMAFNTKSNVNDVYSCSWGPDDNGRTVDGPHHLAQVNQIWKWLTDLLKLPLKVLKGRSSHSEVFCKKLVHKNSAKFIGKHLCQSVSFNKVARLKFLRTPLFIKSFGEGHAQRELAESSSKWTAKF